MSDFVENLIKREIQNYAFEIYNICDKNITDLLFQGKSNDEKSVIIKKGQTLDTIETYGKQKDITILISSDDREILTMDSVDKKFLDIETMKEGIISRVKLNNYNYYAYLMNFQPWNWQIILLVDPSKYLYLENKVKTAYLTSGLILLVGILSLIWLLNITIRKPINSIIESLKRGAEPDYQGTKEIEFLAKTIKIMMDSLEKKVKLLKDKEKELINAKEFNETIMNSLNDALCIIEVGSFKIIETNKVFKGFFGSLEDKTKDKCYELIFNSLEPCKECYGNRVITEGKSITFERIFVDKNSSKRYLEVSISPLKDLKGDITHLVFLAKDITKRKLLEEQLCKSQRLESIGILAGGIAHDLNNILTAIVGYGNLLQMRVANDSTLKHYTEQILKSSDRAANLVSNLLAFSKKQTIHPVALDLNEEINKVFKVLRRLIEKNIEIDLKLSDEKITVMADPSQLDQVIMNLATNARDAMLMGGTLKIETDSVAIGEEDLIIKKQPNMKAGNYAIIKVSDTGLGIDSDDIDKIFDPFFTTKEVGKGTGLGLATVYGIVNQHNGFIDVSSEKGKGTTFTIYLPLVETLVEELKETIGIKYKTELRGKETVLIAEDEDLVRGSYSEILEKFGYKVISAKDGEEALEMFIKNKDEIDLVISDIIMPKKNGKELVKEIQRIKPNIKVIFMSGYSQDLIDDKSLMEDNTYFISKPLPPINLLKLIKELFYKPPLNN
ncbi:MAG: response regulator [Thermodesulfovibrionales bacterium]|nr:response regulator [Thermodesulfovibrionales bacterium]